MEAKILYGRMKWSCEDGMMIVRVEKYREASDRLELVEVISEDLDLDSTIKLMAIDAKKGKWSKKCFKILTKRMIRAESEKLKDRVCKRMQ